jgi:hypothetical protein
MDKVIDQTIRDNRFFVKVPSAETKTGSITIPRAHYIWLKHNPSFKKIPAGYVIHHLDRDETNDDPSNLVLMLKYHHTAYHVKYKIIEVPIHFERVRRTYEPTRIPYISFDKAAGLFYLVIYEPPNDPDNGEKHRIRKVFHYEGKKMFTKEEAEQTRDKLWEKWQYPAG